MKKLPISLVIFTHNSEERIKYLIERHRCVVSQVIVLDQGSVDKTVEIARELADFVVVRRQKGHADPDREYAYALANQKYIISLDDDEELSDEAIEKLENILLTNVDVVWFRRKNLVDGIDISKLMGDDLQCRMWKPGSTKWKDSIHSYCDGAANATVLYTPFDIIHTRTLSGLKKANLFREVKATPRELEMQRSFVAAVEKLLGGTHHG